ncbi:MAG: hypothetical protein MZU95_12940 [Desulfomicrobium escambiense]|nr:hypothetical protein [Desulfomicrobium escambiense]
MLIDIDRLPAEGLPPVPGLRVHQPGPGRGERRVPRAGPRRAHGPPGRRRGPGPGRRSRPG